MDNVIIHLIDKRQDNNDQILFLKMSKEIDWIELKDNIRQILVWSTISILDTLFIALWVFCQWALNKYIIIPLKLTGIDYFTLIIFQILSSISSLAPVAITIYRHIRILIIRTNKKIQNEYELDIKNE